MTKNNADAPDVVSLGCRLNGYESEKMRVLAKEAGVQDAVIVNSCAVTNEAVRQTRQRIRQLKKSNPSANVIVTGCASQIDPASFSAMPEVYSVIGNDEKMRAETWAKLSSAPAKDLVGDIMTATKVAPVDVEPAATSTSRTRSYVQIQNGCDHRCTFCIIPFGRGNSRSVPVGDVISEVRGLVEHGTKEIVLTGVDVTSYGPDLEGGVTLGRLVQSILDDVPDLPRLRLSSIDGAEIDDQLFDLLTGNERVAPYLHLSLQAGDNMILKRMKRRHTREQAIEFCAQIREKRPDVAFGADIIAGFPTETEDMFEQSVRLVDECGLTYLHVFPFSPREGTPAAKMPQLDRSIIKDRAARLRTVGDRALARFLDGFVGSEVSVLTEKASAEEISAGRGHGRMANFAEVEFSADGLPLAAEPGQFVRVSVSGHDGQKLSGSFLGKDSA